MAICQPVVCGSISLRGGARARVGTPKPWLVSWSHLLGPACRRRTVVKVLRELAIRDIGSRLDVNEEKAVYSLPRRAELRGLG